MEVEGIVGQVKFKVALGLVGWDRNWVRFGIVGPPDGIEASPLQWPASDASGPRFKAVVIGPCWYRGGTYEPVYLNGQVGREVSSLILSSP